MEDREEDRRGERSSSSSSGMSSIKKESISLAASIQEGFSSFKASLFGLRKKMMARSEEERTMADLQAAKMQVEAADAAEDTKKRLDDK